VLFAAAVTIVPLMVLVRNSVTVAVAMTEALRRGSILERKTTDCQEVGLSVLDLTTTEMGDCIQSGLYHPHYRPTSKEQPVFQSCLGDRRRYWLHVGVEIWNRSPNYRHKGSTEARKSWCNISL
jgi:hypothetical protein